MSGGLYSLFATDKKAEEEGRWIDYLDADTRVRVTRAGGKNKKFQRVLEALTKPHKRAIQADMMSNEKMREITMQAFLESVIVDWQTRVDGEWVPGIQNKDKEVVPFTKEAAKQVLTDLPDLFDDIVDYAQKSAMFREEGLEADAGN